MKLKALIIDDEPLAHEILQEYAEDSGVIEVVGQSYSATHALTFLATNKVDLLFLDINMPKLNGLDFLRLLQDKPQVIITSAYQEYALESYELEVCDYLLKPIRFDRFLKAVQKARHWHDLHKKEDHSLPAEEEKEESKQLFIKADKRLVQLSWDEIVFVESYGNYVKIWTGDNYLLTTRTLSSMEQQLPESAFIRIHKSFLVQKAQVAYVEGNNVVMKNKKELPLGKNYRQAFRQFLL